MTLRSAGVVCLSLLSIAPGRAQGPLIGDPFEARIERLEARLKTQQQRVSELERAVSSASPMDVERSRAEALKQQIREVLRESGFQERLFPSTLAAGYDAGFFLRSTDDTFLIRFNGLLQFRFTHYDAQSRNRYLLPRLEREDRTGFDLNRIRFWISGNVYAPELTYYLQWGADAGGAYDAALYYAWFNFRFADALQVRFGIFDLSSTRNTFNDDATQHFVDRPLFDAVYGLGAGLGARIWGQSANRRLDYYLDVVNSTSDGENTATGRTITPDPAERDSTPAILFRTVWHALGDDPAALWAEESDRAGSASPALDFGFHYAFNDDQGDAATTRLPIPRSRAPAVGDFELTTVNATQINQFGFDSAFKFRGFSLIGEYALRLIDPRRGDAPFALLTGQDSTVAQHGAVLSGGYFLPIPGLERQLELVARVGGMSALAEDREGTWEYAAGLNYFVEGESVKLQADVTRINQVPITSSYSSLANVNDDALIIRIQMQVAF